MVVECLKVTDKGPAKRRRTDITGSRTPDIASCEISMRMNYGSDGNPVENSVLLAE